MQENYLQMQINFVAKTSFQNGTLLFLGKPYATISNNVLMPSDDSFVDCKTETVSRAGKYE